MYKRDGQDRKKVSNPSPRKALFEEEEDEEDEGEDEVPGVGGIGVC